MKTSYYATLVLMVLLVALCAAWELKLAPLRPGGSWLALKVLPLLMLWRGLLHGRRRTFQLTSLLIWFYFAEGVMRAWGDRGLSAGLALGEAILSLLIFVTVAWYSRVSAGRPGV